MSHPTAFVQAARTGRGFTLVEMLVVVAIMAVLASIAMPMTELAQRRTKEEELRRSLREIRGALDQYKRLVDAGHITRAPGDSGYPPTLQVLVDGVVDAQSPQGARIFLLRSLPRDPFAPFDVGDAASTWSLRAYASPPDDPQPGADVFDIHSTSPVLGLNGVAYRAW